MTLNKVLYPGPGCLVEFFQGNTPTQAIVLEEHSGKLRLYAINHRESSLPAVRLLPWSGPSLGSGLSRQAMDEALEKHREIRSTLADEIAPLEVWELTQGEVPKASISWLAGLLWENPTIDQEAALGHVLLATKTHFRFAPPDFEIFTEEIVEQRLAEAESARIREEFAITGAQFFQKLWEIHTQKRGPLVQGEEPEEPLATKLKEIVFTRIADPDSTADAAVWKLLVKGLPDVPHLPLHLATAWKLVPLHYNFWLDRAGFAPGETWADAFGKDCESIVASTSEALATLLEDPTPFVSVDPSTTVDRDDAFYVTEREDGSFTVSIALACPALAWPFGCEFDKIVQSRVSSIYLPEGNLHMLPGHVGRDLFSLDEHKRRPGFIVELHLSAEGDILDVTPRSAAVGQVINLDLESCEAAMIAAEEADVTANEVPIHARPLIDMLGTALRLARRLQQKRVDAGAVITERPDPEVTVEGTGADAVVRIENGADATRAHLAVGEMMILCNGALAQWGMTRAVPLFFRTQDVALPREFAGIWTQPQDISRVVRALPPASLETVAKRHAGLGLAAYATFSSPIRRYTDLVNQAQILTFLNTGTARLSQQEITALLPHLSTRSDAVTQVQRMRPRYWKLLFFRQQGDKKWWDGVIADENEAFVTISLPWAHLMVRGKRRQFDDKIYPGMHIQVRLGKVNPLHGEIQVVETRES